MQGKIKSLVICVAGAAAIAGCASSPSSQKTASNQDNIQRGKVTAVESVAVVQQAAVPTSSGSSAVVTAASGVPVVITVQFNDGSQSKYAIEQSASEFAVGQPVAVVKQGDGYIIKSQ